MEFVGPLYYILCVSRSLPTCRRGRRDGKHPAAASNKDSRSPTGPRSFSLPSFGWPGVGCALAHALPPHSSAAGERCTYDVGCICWEYQASARQLQEIHTAVPHLARQGHRRRRKPCTYADAIDKRLAVADAYFFTESSAATHTPAAKKGSKKRKRK